MADPQTHANGIENGLEEEDVTKLRPADIDADVKEMERRKRVEMIMNSKLFREELERIIEMQMKDGNGPAGLLQQISDMMGIQAGKLHTTHMFRGSNCVTPINDIRGVESMAYAKGEKNLRCKLASVFRLMDLYGWSQGIHNQITVRLNQDEEHFLVNPYGMLYNEITASSLVKVDMQGNVVESGTTNFTVNTQVFLLHSSIHASRPDVKCIIHIHTPSVLAVSSLKCGLLPLCQEALVIGEVSQHPFVSGIFEPEEREKIIRNLGPRNKILLLHNHGALCCGETVEEAFYNVYNMVLACETQIKLIPMGVENLVLVNDETRKQVYDAAHRAPEAEGDKKTKHFRVGELEFEALIRMLDNAGFRTGYIYRHPLVKGEIPKPKNDVEVPPAVSSLGYLIEEEKLYNQGNRKKYVDGRNRLDRTKWLNSPNVYQKVEILETGTSDPKKITKWVDQNSEEWVAENSPTHSSTPVKIDSALQFVPKNTNPKEFKKLQQQIKENRLADKITSGPQSHILEGVSWEEAKKLQDANITQTGDQVILVGAASKGIIQRNFQHNALVYKTPYAKNPFDSISDKEIEDYKRLVERKQRGDTDYEESQSESEAVSSRQEALRHIKSPLMSPQSATSETEEESRDEPRVLRIETKTAPQPIQAEVVLSDAEFDTTDARVERSQSARYPKAEKPESVTIVNSFRKSWSLKRDKDKNKDIEFPDEYCSRSVESELMLTNFNVQSEDPLQTCVARISNLTQLPVLVDVRSKSASDPCNLARVSEESSSSDKPSSFDDCHAEHPSDSDSNSELKRTLNLRKKLIYSAKMKFLGLEPGERSVSPKTDASPGSRICALISEIRDKINEIMTPNGKKEIAEWVPRRNMLGRYIEDSDTKEEECSTQLFEEGHCERTDVKLDAQVIKSLLIDLVRQVDSQEDEATYTIASESDIQSYSFTETTETEWYYNKTKLDNTQTVVEVLDMREGVKQSDTGIETDFTSEKDASEETAASAENPSVLNKSSETDSSLLKSGRTSTDIDTSFAFRTETENSEKQENGLQEEEEGPKKSVEPSIWRKLPDIPESPEFTNVDTEDAPATSSSKNSSPDTGNEVMPVVEPKKPVEEPREETKERLGRKQKKKKRGKKSSSTKITVKKELTEHDSEEPVVSEIKLTIKNSNGYASEKYEFEIQDETNTSGEMSRTTSSLGEPFEGYELVEGNCDCDAQQNLDNLRNEVETTIEKLQDIENYFEDEIRKETSGFGETVEEAEELVITYSYQESEEVLANDCVPGNAEAVLMEDEMIVDHVEIVSNAKVSENEDDAKELIDDDDAVMQGEKQDTFNETDETNNNQINEKISVKPKLEDLFDVEAFLNRIISMSEIRKCSRSDVNDIFNFVLKEEDSPSDSFDENPFCSGFDLHVTNAEEEEVDATTGITDRRNGSATFNVLVATPTGREIFINYNEKTNSSFCMSPKGGGKSNSYINTDDVNDDFEDSPEWFSVGSPSRMSQNTSFESAISNFEGGSSPARIGFCGDYGSDIANGKKSPGSLAIIEEVEEVECATFGENTFNGDHSDAHQSTFSHSSKEGSPTKDRSTEESPKKEKKKKKGLRTPSFLKKKKEKKKVEA